MRETGKLILILLAACTVMAITFLGILCHDAHAGPFGELGSDTKYILVSYNINPSIIKYQIAVPLVYKNGNHTFLYNTFRQHIMDAHILKNPNRIIISDIFPYSGFYFSDE